MSQITINLPENWKTTLWGIVGAIAIGLAEYVTSGQITWQGAVAATLVAIKGYISADAIPKIKQKTEE